MICQQPVNMIYVIVNSDTIVDMCMEVIICQLDRFLERWMICHIPSIWRTSYHLRSEKECGGNSLSFWGDFCKSLPTQNRIFLTFQKCGILDFVQFCICQYDKCSSKRWYSTIHGCGIYNLSIWDVPWKVDDISDP